MTIWLASDHHLFHENMMRFEREPGVPLRHFKDAAEMNEVILENHNAVVSTSDHVYFMGDVTFKYGKEFDTLFNAFKGKKRLIVGNHDTVKNMANHFQKISCWRYFNEKDVPGFIPFTATHVPIHPGSCKGLFNAHGHTHWNLVTKTEVLEGFRPQVTLTEPNLFYLNLCMERTDYKPVSLAQVQSMLRERVGEC